MTSAHHTTLGDTTMGFLDDFDVRDYLPDIDPDRFTPAGIRARRLARENRRRAKSLRRRQEALRKKARNLPREYERMARRHMKRDLAPFRDAFEAIRATDMVKLDFDSSAIDLHLVVPKVRHFDYVQWDGIEDTIEWISDVLTMPFWGQRELVEQKQLAARLRHAKAQARREEARLEAIEANVRIGRKTLNRIARRMRPLNTWLAQRVAANPEIRSFNEQEVDAVRLLQGLAIAMTVVLRVRPVDEQSRRAKPSKEYRRQAKDTGKALRKKARYAPPASGDHKDGTE